MNIYQSILMAAELSSPLVLLVSVFICWLLAAAALRDSTTSGITASINDNDSITRSEPSWKVSQENPEIFQWLGFLVTRNIVYKWSRNWQ